MVEDNLGPKGVSSFTGLKLISKLRTKTLNGKYCGTRVRFPPPPPKFQGSFLINPSTIMGLGGFTVKVITAFYGTALCAVH